MSGAKLTQSAAAERARIQKVFEAAVMETVRLMLGSGLPGGTPHERQKTRWIIKGFEHATTALRKALDDTDRSAPKGDAR